MKPDINKEEAEELLKRFRERYPELSQYFQGLKQPAKTRQECQNEVFKALYGGKETPENPPLQFVSLTGRAKEHAVLQDMREQFQPKKDQVVIFPDFDQLEIRMMALLLDQEKKGTITLDGAKVLSYIRGELPKK